MQDYYGDNFVDCDWCGSLDIDPEQRYYELTDSDVLCKKCCDEAEKEAESESA